MSGTWDDLRCELHRERMDAQLLGHDWDVSDAVEAVARWLGIPPPRQTPETLARIVTAKWREDEA